MEHACRTYHLIMTKTLKKNLEILFELKKNITNRPILIFGHSGVKKSLLMKLFSLMTSLMNDKQFLTHWIKLDGLDYESLFGNFIGKKYQEGLLRNLLEAIEQKKELFISNNIGFQRKEISSNHFFTFSSELANPELILERKSSDLDWIIFDNGSLGGYYEKLLEMATNRIISQENGGKIEINNSISLFFEVFLIIFLIFLLKKY